MKKLIVKILGSAILIGIIFIAFVFFKYPDVSVAPGLKVPSTPEIIFKGEYLANTLASCVDCHSPRNWKLMGGPVYKDSLYAGSNEEFTAPYDFPGNYYAPNLTPYNLKNWTDGEIFRAITTGVSKNGRALFPVMPYHNYGKMDKSDVYAIIAYLRTLPEVKKETKTSTSDFPMNIIIRTFPTEGTFVFNSKEKNKIKHGEYMATIAGCNHCHTKMEKGKPVKGFEFAGGNEYRTPNGSAVSANITPDKETGIGKWTREAFIARFRSYSDSLYKPFPVSNGYNSIMPWQGYSKMDSMDLSAIYDYLQSLKPVTNRVIDNVKK